MTAIYLKTDYTLEEINTLYDDYYNSHPFIILIQEEISLKQVVNTNKSILRLNKHGDILLIENIIDNLLKELFFI